MTNFEVLSRATSPLAVSLCHVPLAVMIRRGENVTGFLLTYRPFQTDTRTRVSLAARQVSWFVSTAQPGTSLWFPIVSFTPCLFPSLQMKLA